MSVHDLKILICDDSLLIRKKLKQALTERGFVHILEASDGIEAVETSRREQPDLVLMDIVMPNKDGLEALKEIKQINPGINVVMASSVGTQGNLIKALKAGASNFLQKPIPIEGVLDQLKKIDAERRER
jgi:two-component system chemotaxis response regulator CheY